MGKDIWEILGIKETFDENQIKMAYRNKLKDNNPEEEQEAFMELRRAYELACEYAKNKDSISKDTKEEKSEADLWIDEVSKLYNNYWERQDEKKWESLLRQDVCQSLDTSNEACEKLLVFMMDNYNFDHKIYKLFDKTFAISQMKEEWYNLFPESYIDYIIHRIEEEQEFCFDLFEKNDKYTAKDYDKYYSTYMKYKLHEFEKNEDTDKLYEELLSLEVYHPFTDAEKIKKAINNKEFDKVKELIAKLDKEEYLSSIYLLMILGDAKVKTGDINNGEEYLLKAYDKKPSNQIIFIKLLECKKAKKEFAQIFDMCQDSLEKYNENEQIDALFREACENILDDLKRSVIIEGKKERLHDLLICFCECEKYKECIRWMKNNSIIKRDDVYYYEYLGRCYLNLGEYEKAIAAFQSSIDKMKKFDTYIKKYPAKDKTKQEVDNKESIYNRIKRKSYICYLVALTYNKLVIKTDDKDKKNVYLSRAVHYLTKAKDYENDKELKNFYKEHIAVCKMDMDQDEEALRLLNEVILNSKKYLELAIMDRIKLYYKKDEFNGVIDDAKTIIGKYSRYHMPYVYCIQVYFKIEEYDEVEAVLETVKQNYISQPIFKYLKALLVLKTYKEESKLNEQIDILKKMLADNPFKEDNEYKKDLNMDIWLEYIIAKLYYEKDDYENALKYLNIAVDKYKNNLKFMDLKASIYYELEEYQKSIEILNVIIKNYSQNSVFYADLARNYKKLGYINKAKKLLEQGLSNDPNSILCKTEIAQIYLIEYRNFYDYKDYVKARNIQKSIVKEVEYERCYLALCDTYILGYEYEKALECAKIALEKFGKTVYICQALGEINKLMGNYMEAIDYFKIINKNINECGGTKNYNFSYLMLSEIYQRQGMLSSALKVLDEAKKNVADKFLINMSEIDVHNKLKNYSDALRICNFYLSHLKKTEFEKIKIVVEKSLKTLYLSNRINEAEQIVNSYINLCEQKADDHSRYNKYMLMYTYACLKNAEIAVKREILENAFEHLPEYIEDAMEGIVSLLKCCYKMEDKSRIEEVYDRLHKMINSQYENYQRFIKYRPHSKENATNLGLAAFYAKDLKLCKECMLIARNASPCYECDKNNCEKMCRLNAEMSRFYGELNKCYDYYSKAYECADGYYPEIIDDMCEICNKVKQ